MTVTGSGVPVMEATRPPKLPAEAPIVYRCVDDSPVNVYDVCVVEDMFAEAK